MPVRRRPIPRVSSVVGYRWPEDELPAWARAAGRDSRSGKLARRRCGQYGPGHEPHWIQVKKAAGDPEPAVRARLVGVEGDDLLVVRVVGASTVQHYLSHELPVLVEAAGGLGRLVEIQDRWSVLHAGDQVFSVCRNAAGWRSCHESPTDSGSPA